jgi:hypothetical protein
VRAIVIAGAIFLVAVAAASGAPRHAASAGVTQKALEAPRVAATQVACPSATSCVAVGGSYLLVEHAGKWSRVHSPLPPQPGKGAAVDLLSVACPSSGRCAAAGSYGERRAVVLTEGSGKWHLGVPALPGTPTGASFPGLTSVSCGRAGSCAAVGAYRFPRDTPLLVQEQNSVWGSASEPALPPNAATSAEAGLSLVSCPSAGSCAAAGTYTKDASAGQYPWLVDETAGKWGQGAAVQLPADAKLAGDSERSGTSPFFGFAGLSCPSAGSCTAVGGYWGRTDVQNGLLVTERNGTWSRGVKAPVPANAGSNTAGPNEFTNPLAGVACAASNDCAAIGSYVDKSKHHHGLLLAERSGKWKAHELLVPAGAPANAAVTLTSVSCASRGDCVAVGYYSVRPGETRGLVVRERGGKWGRAANAALPKGPASASKSHTFLNSVSCGSAKMCTAVGSYADRSGVTQGLLLSLRLR